MQLPLPPMLMFDRILEIEDCGKYKEAQDRRVRYSARFVVFFMSLSRRSCDARLFGLDAMWQLVGFFAGRAC